MLIASNIYAQQQKISHKSNIKDILIEHLAVIHDFPDSFRNGLETYKESFITDSIEVFFDPVVVFNLSNEMVNPDNITDKYGIFQFYCPLVMPIRCDIFLKYCNEVTTLNIIDSNDLIQQTEKIIKFFYKHPDIPRRYFNIYLKYMLDTHEANLSILE